MNTKPDKKPHTTNNKTHSDKNKKQRPNITKQPKQGQSKHLANPKRTPQSMPSTSNTRPKVHAKQTLMVKH